MRVIDKIVACMEINTSIGCPNACVFCPQERFVKAYKKRSGIDFNKNMSLQNFKNCLDKIPRYVRINFSGMSEPWLNPDCTKMLLYAHKKGFTITVFTTTVGLSIKDIDLIKKIPFKSFTVHLPEKNNKFSKIPYDDELLKKIDKIVECISNLKFMAFGEVRPEIKKIIPQPITEGELIFRAGNLEKKSGSSFKLLKENFNPTVKIKGRIKCYWSITKYPIANNLLLPNGDVVLCCMDYSIKHVIGNLLRQDYEDLFRSSEIKKIFKGFKNEKSDIICRYCEIAMPYPIKRRLLIQYKSIRLGIIENVHKYYDNFGNRSQIIKKIKDLIAKIKEIIDNIFTVF